MINYPVTNCHPKCERDNFRAYMREIDKIPFLSPDEEVTYARQNLAGDIDAQRKLVESNLRLVVKFAYGFRGLGLPLLDLIEEGNEGLMEAVERYDPSKGAKLSSYASWRIKQRMRRALSREGRGAHLPQNVPSHLGKINSAKLRLQESLNREPTYEEIAKEADLSVGRVEYLSGAATNFVHLQDHLDQGEGTYEDVVSDRFSEGGNPEQERQRKELFHSLERVMQGLDEREKEISYMRFGFNDNPPRTLEEVSQIVGITRERVRQIQERALEKLKEGLATRYGITLEALACLE